MAGIGVEVCGVPRCLSNDRMIDKLTIHFLRPRHGGGEVQRVLFPTSTTGQAFVIFELAEVAARVRKLSHVLEVEGRFYPLDIREADRPEMDMPVRATLDVNMFSNTSAVLPLLRSYGFKVSETHSGLLLDGSFQNLRLVRTQLQKLQAQDSQYHRSSPPPSQYHRSSPSPSQYCSSSPSPSQYHHSSPSPSQYHHSSPSPSQYRSSSPSPSQYHHSSPPPSQYHRSSPPPSLPNGLASGTVPRSDLNVLASGAVPRSPARTSHVNGVGTHAGSRSPAVDRRKSLQHGPPGSLPIPQPSSPSSGASASPRSLPSFSDDSTSSPLHRRPSSPRRPRELSFPVDTDVFRYAQCYRQEGIQEILAHGIQMTDREDSGFTTVSLLGRDPEMAKVKLQVLLDGITPSLRTQEIHLSKYDSHQQVQIGKKVLVLKDLYQVLVRQEGDIIRLVGSSGDSYEMRQRLLGREVALPAPVPTERGRGVERGPRARRSTSLPKSRNVREPDPARQPGPQASAARGYSPSRYQDDSRSGRTAQAAGGVQSSPHAEPHRRRSSSESRDKVKGQRVQPKPERNDLVPSSGAQMPVEKKQPSSASSPPPIKQPFWPERFKIKNWNKKNTSNR